MNKLNFLGIGPKIGRIALPWLALAIFFSVKFKDLFAFGKDQNKILFYFGVLFLITGLIFYFITLPLLLKGIKEKRLITTGTFSVCCNPLYAAIILFIFPGISLMMNSWLVLTTSIVAFILFKIHIRNEYTEMEKNFGDDYRKYRADTPEFLPFPLYKLFR